VEVITTIEDDQIEADEIAAASTETRAGESALMRSVRDGLLGHRGARASEVQRIAYSRELTNTLGKLGANPAAEAPVSLADILAGSPP
jgi:hypothetical protein